MKNKKHKKLFNVLKLWKHSGWLPWIPRKLRASLCWSCISSASLFFSIQGKIYEWVWTMEAHQERQPEGRSKALMAPWRLIYLALSWILQSVLSFLQNKLSYKTARRKLACVPWLWCRLGSSFYEHLLGVQTYVVAWSNLRCSNFSTFLHICIPGQHSVTQRGSAEGWENIAVCILIPTSAVFIFYDSWRQFWSLQPNWLSGGKPLK